MAQNAKLNEPTELSIELRNSDRTVWSSGEFSRRHWKSIAITPTSIIFSVHNRPIGVGINGIVIKLNEKMSIGEWELMRERLLLLSGVTQRPWVGGHGKFELAIYMRSHFMRIIHVN